MHLIPWAANLRRNLAGSLFQALLYFLFLTFASTRNYDHVSGLWAHENWLPQGAVQQAKAHYGAYSVQRQDGLRIITLNTDLCS